MSNKQEKSDVITSEQSRVEVFRRPGLSETIDFTLLRQICDPYISREEEYRRYIKRDLRGEEFARYIYKTCPRSPNTLPLVLVGLNHVPAIASQVGKHYFHPLTTSFLTEKYYLDNKSDYEPLGNNMMSGNKMALIDFLEFSLLYKYETKKYRGQNPIILIGEIHGKQYQVTLPSSDELIALGISRIVVYLESLPKGIEELEHFFSRTYLGFRILGEYLKQYSDSGIIIEIRGLEEESQ